MSDYTKKLITDVKDATRALVYARQKWLEVESTTGESDIAWDEVIKARNNLMVVTSALEKYVDDLENKIHGLGLK